MPSQVRRDVSWSPTRKAIALGLARGKTNRQIARELGVTTPSLVRDVTSLMHEAGVDSRSAIVALAYIDGVLDISSWPPTLAGEPASGG